MDGDFFRAVVASLSDGVLVVDCEEVLLYHNPCAETLLGPLSAGMPFSAIASRLAREGSDGEIPRADLPPVRALGTGPRAALDVVVRRTGTILRFASSPLHGPGGVILGTVSVLTDVTEHKKTDADLEKARTFLDSIVENIPDMIFVKDARDLRFERFNRAGEELLGIPRADLLGKSDHDLFPPEQADFFQRRDHETLSSGRLVDIEEEPIDTVSGQKWLHTKKIPIRGERGEPLYLLGISSDITARRRAEEALKHAHEDLERRVAERTLELRKTEEQLRHAQKLEAVGRLAGGVAHDFNNVLAVILGHVGLLLQSTTVEEPVLEGLDSIRAAAEHAATLTRQLLAFSRKQVMQPRLVNLNRIVEQARGMLSRLIGEDVTVVTRLSPDLGNIHADPALIEQVFVNLAVNGRDAMPNGGELSIETRNVTLGDAAAGIAPGTYVELAVRDTGIGMDEETRGRVFEPFFTTKGPGKGTGLGLSMAYGVVAQSGGTITVDSSPGQGTTFRVHLPAVRGQRSLTPAPGPIALLPRGNETVLVAEDEAALRSIVRAVLEQAGYQVLDAPNGEEALRVAARHQSAIHLLLTDVVMPQMDGPTLARNLKAWRPTMRVLFMSGYADERLAGYVGDSTVSPLAKPFSVETLTARVREALDAPVR